eukprot:CAMPEP_0206498520 /NCGR_PEP_ID=MMETSP0324_2-20121206/51063_1 /ASSEMBLY_ACC=CAM_ASM_000836 /TAXON_ID=2866 /ORGANISM="Crypthecodinium cohnii, Strain Seligo" /LENGTH=821 /DNA_ID=CAMNT_0053984763 /DNA_START=110 /DNA_END=2575 /DNA_ORIENTATION=+
MSQHHSQRGGGGGGAGGGGPGSELLAALIRRRRIVEGSGSDFIAAEAGGGGMKNSESHRGGVRQKGSAHMLATSSEAPDWRREMSTYLGMSPPPALEEDGAPVPPPAAFATASMKATGSATATMTMSAPNSRMMSRPPPPVASSPSPSASFSPLAASQPFHKCPACQKSESEKALLRSQQQTMERELQSLRKQLYRAKAKTEVIDSLSETLKLAYVELEGTKTKLQEEQEHHKRTELSLQQVVRNNEAYRDELIATRQIGQELQALKESLASAETAQHRLEEKNEHYQRELQSAADHPHELEALKRAMADDRKAFQEKLEVSEAFHRQDLKTIEELREQIASSELSFLRISAEKEQEQEKHDLAQKSVRGYAKELESSESRLRIALSRPGATTTEEMRQAVGCVDALLQEGRRELANRELRDRRAAYEELNQAQVQNNEDALIKALEAARRANIDEDDLKHAANKLLELQSMSEGEKLAREMDQKRRKHREMAFVLVKRDDVQGLSQLLEEIDNKSVMLANSPSDCTSPVSTARWWEWKDHAQRTLLKSAQQLKSGSVQEYLEVKLQEIQASLSSTKGQATEASTRTTLSSKVCFFGVADFDSPRASKASSKDPPAFESASSETPTTTASRLDPQATAKAFDPETTPEVSVEDSVTSQSVARESLPASPAVNEEEEEENSIDASDPRFKEGSELWKQAFRSVVKDDTAALSDVINDKVPRRVWMSWRNKAGKDLLTLSEERGSSAAYSVLAKAMGLLQERPREAYEDRDSVWIFLDGEVQPLQATVLEDTPVEADQIYVQFWVGEESPRYVDRSMVFKTNA